MRLVILVTDSRVKSRNTGAGGGSRISLLRTSIVARYEIGPAVTDQTRAEEDRLDGLQRHPVLSTHTHQLRVDDLHKLNSLTKLM